MSDRIAPAVFERDNRAKIPLVELRSAVSTQTPWFAFGVAVLFVALAVAIEPERAWLFGVAGIAFVLGVLDWVGDPDEDML